MDSGALTEPLWDASTVSYPYPNNIVFVREYTIKLLGSSFPNMTLAEVIIPFRMSALLSLGYLAEILSILFFPGDEFC